MFQIVSFIIAAICLLKAGVALVKASQFYGWRQQQYAATTVPRVVLVTPILMLILAVVIWYATLFHYQPWGWIVTAFTTFIAVIGIVNLNRWTSHRQKVAQAIKTQPAKRRIVDIVISFLGLFFLGLALFVY